MPEKKKSGEWTARLFLVGIGVYILYAGPTNAANLLLGIPLSAGPLIESVEFRDLFKLTINRVSGKEVFQIQEVRDSKIFQGGYHYHEAPTAEKPETEKPQPGSPQSNWDVDEEFQLEAGSYRYFSLEITVGDKLSGYTEADEPVSCYILGPNSLQSFENDNDFNPYWDSENVTRTKVSYAPKTGHKFFFLVSLDEDAEEDATVTVKLRIESGFRE